jgi:hypothetical protein
VQSATHVANLDSPSATVQFETAALAFGLIVAFLPRREEKMGCVNLKILYSFAMVTAFVAIVGAQQPAVTVDDDDITIRGCVRQVDLQASTPSLLVWSRGDLMLMGAAAASGDAPNPIGTAGFAGRVFYWLDDDEDLAKHVGQHIEISGDLKEIEKGEIEIKRDGAFTKIEIELDDEKETARVPTSWLGVPAGDNEREFDIVARRVDVDDVRVLGACTVP